MSPTEQTVDSVLSLLSKESLALSDAQQVAQLAQSSKAQRDVFEQWLATQLELMGDPPQSRVLVESRAVDFSDVMPQLEQASPEGEDGEAPKEDPKKG